MQCRRPSRVAALAIAVLLCFAIVPTARLVAQGIGLPKLIPPTPGTYRQLTFSELAAFVYNGKEQFSAEPTKVLNGVPFQIRVLDGQQIEIVGLMMPLAIGAKGGASEFILATNSDACGFGMPLRINEWALVRMAAGKTARHRDGAVTVRGVLHVAEEVEAGRVIGLFRITADEVR
jgi:hypothetical protein